MINQYFLTGESSSRFPVDHPTTLFRPCALALNSDASARLNKASQLSAPVATPILTETLSCSLDIELLKFNRETSAKMLSEICNAQYDQSKSKIHRHQNVQSNQIAQYLLLNIEQFQQ